MEHSFEPELKARIQSALVEVLRKSPALGLVTEDMHDPKHTANAVGQPATFLEKHANRGNALHSITKMLACAQGWAPADRFAYMALMTASFYRSDLFASIVVEILEHIIDAAIVDKDAKADTVTSAMQEFLDASPNHVAMTIADRNSEHDIKCPVHATMVPPGTACKDCAQDIVDKRPPTVTEDEARERVAQITAEALAEIAGGPPPGVTIN